MLLPNESACHSWDLESHMHWCTKRNRKHTFGPLDDPLDKRLVLSMDEPSRLFTYSVIWSCRNPEECCRNWWRLCFTATCAKFSLFTDANRKSSVFCLIFHHYGSILASWRCSNNVESNYSSPTYFCGKSGGRRSSLAANMTECCSSQLPVSILGL